MFRMQEEPPENDEGCKLFRGSGSDLDRWYCSRVLGEEAIPGSDGRCGPNSGPQCASCTRFQETWQVNDEWFPVQRASNGLYYCSRIFGMDVECGPDEGPQCKSCKRYQEEEERAQEKFLHALERAANGRCYWP